MRKGVEKRKCGAYPQNIVKCGMGVRGRGRNVQVQAPSCVLRLLDINHDPEGVAFVHQVKKHSLLPSESSLTCAQLSVFSAHTWQHSCSALLMSTRYVSRGNH